MVGNEIKWGNIEFSSKISKRPRMIEKFGNFML